jgi:hypothetical protein
MGACLVAGFPLIYESWSLSPNSSLFVDTITGDMGKWNEYLLLILDEKRSS